MFNLIEKHQKLVKVLMGAVAVSFILWGVGGYLSMGSDDSYVAKVGSNKIYTQDIEQIMAQDPKNNDKMQILTGLINRQLLVNNFNDYHLTISDQELADYIIKIPEFQTNNNFDSKKYQQFLSSHYLSVEKFQHEITTQLLITQFLDFFKDSYFNSQLYQNKLAQVLSRTRVVSSYIIPSNKFLSLVNISESMAQAYYQQNQIKFKIAQQVKLQYLTLSKDQVAENILVDNSDVDKYLSSHQDSLNNTQIDVSHILFSVKKNASAKLREQVRLKALAVLAQVKAHPNDFIKYVKQYSDDLGSKDKGGDLGFFAHGVMVKPFEQVAFSLKKNEISSLVTTEYGYHILKLNDIKVENINIQRSNAKSVIQKQKMELTFGAKLDKLNDLSYNNPNSLDSAAKALNLNIQFSPWISLGESTGLFAESKLQDVIFSADLIKNHNNSKVIDLGNGIYGVYRVNDYQTAKTIPFNQVNQQINKQLRIQIASQMAKTQGEKYLKALDAGKMELDFINKLNINLMTQNASVTPSAIKQLMGLKLNPSPTYTGLVNPSGDYVIYRIESETIDHKLLAQNEQSLSTMADANSSLDFNVYLNLLNTKYTINYKLDRMQQN